MTGGGGRVLFMGFGNPGRQDDGLGPALAAAVEKLEIPGVTVDSNYQPTVEDAAALAEHDFAVFADAALTGSEPFSFTPLAPGRGESFSTHSIRPENVLGLARQLFQARTETYLLGIRGYEFDMFDENLSTKAAANLAGALRFIEPVLRQRSFAGAVTAEVDP